MVITVGVEKMCRLHPYLFRGMRPGWSQEKVGEEKQIHFLLLAAL